MTMSFIPQDYVAPAPVNGKYLKLPEDGKYIRFAVIGMMVSGYAYWTEDKQVIRSKEMPLDTPGIREGEKAKHFWLLNVFDIDAKEVKLLEITQASVQKAIHEMVLAGDYDFMDGTNGFRISRVGKGKMDTKYSAVPTPIKPGEERDAFAAIDVDALPDLNKVAFEKREPKPDVTETAPEVM